MVPELEGKDWPNNSILSISEDSMVAKLMLWPSAGDEDATVEEVVAFMTDRNVTTGIRYETIKRMLEEKLYLEDIVVAEGEPPIIGRNGEYEFYIELKRERKPKILPDGSVDYTDYNAVTVVKQDDLLVEYIPCEKGADGFDIKGRVLPGKKGIDQPAIKGKGFYTSEDGLKYYASFDGRAECTNGYMVVSHDLVIKDDVDRVYGNIDFVGDVRVLGDVMSNMTIKTSGYITVEGHVEGAHLIAGKGVILKNGMQGSGIGRIDCTGDVEGKFFEQTTIVGTGNLHANAILNCDIKMNGSITVEGSLGALVGGKAWAGTTIKAANIGNMSNVKTELIVGTKEDTEATINKLQEELKAATTELYKTEGKIKLLEDALDKGLGQETVVEIKKQLLRSKIVMKSNVTDKQTQLAELYEAVERASNACVVASGQIYPGTTCLVNGAFMKVPDVVNSIMIRKKSKDAVMYPYSGQAI